MAHEPTQEGRTSNRGFASMNRSGSGRSQVWVAKRFPTRSAVSRRTDGWQPRPVVRAGRACLARSGVSRRIASSPPWRVVKAGRACPMRNAASRRIRSSPPRRAARVGRPVMAVAPAGAELGYAPRVFRRFREGISIFVRWQGCREAARTPSRHPEPVRAGRRSFFPVGDARFTFSRARVTRCAVASGAARSSARR